MCGHRFHGVLSGVFCDVLNVWDFDTLECAETPRVLNKLLHTSCAFRLRDKQATDSLGRGVQFE